MGRTDAELIAACQAGDAAAFGEIVARYQRAVVAVAYAGVRDRVLAEDVAQDAFVTAWRRLSALRDVERLPAWLCGIARNVARARKRIRGREVAETDVAGDVTPFTSLDDAEREAAIAAALARVPEAYREPLVLVYCEQQPAKDVARVLGMTDAAVHQRLSRGRAWLASDAELVEHAGSRSRRDLAAAVLAAIALGVGSSRVEASPRGLSMFKLTAIAITGSLAAGTTYVVARGTHSSPTTSATSTPARTPISALHPRSSPGSRALFAFTPTPHASASAGTSATLSCNEVGTHMANLAFDSASSVPPDGPQRDAIVAPVVTRFEEACERYAWPQDYRACLVGAPDSFSMWLDCAPYRSLDTDLDTTVEFDGSAGDIVLQTSPDPVAPSSDSTCAGVAKHMAELYKPDPKSLAKLSAIQRAKVEPALEAAQGSVLAQAEQGCTDTAWPEARRRCLAAATTVAEMNSCQ